MWFLLHGAGAPRRWDTFALVVFRLLRELVLVLFPPSHVAREDHFVKFGFKVVILFWFFFFLDLLLLYYWLLDWLLVVWIFVIDELRYARRVALLQGKGVLRVVVHCLPEIVRSVKELATFDCLRVFLRKQIDLMLGIILISMI